MMLALLATPVTASAQTPPPATPPESPPRPISATPGGPGAPASPPPTAGATPPAATAAPATPAAPVVPKPAWKAPSGGGTKALPKLPEPPPPPDTPARLWLVAPGPREPWTMRIDNEGARAIRIPADVRLLSFEIEVQSADPKKKKPTVYKCDAPASIKPTAFPERRALLLGPEQSYIETFDPRLFCFGKNADALVGTALVKARFGWAPPVVSKWAAKKNKAPQGPFAVESADSPAPTSPRKQLEAPSIVLSFGTQGAASEPPSTIAGADVNVPGAPAPGAYRPLPPAKAAPPPPPPPPQHNPLAPLRSGGKGRDVAISRKRLDEQITAQKEANAHQRDAAASPAATTTAADNAATTTSAASNGTPTPDAAAPGAVPEAAPAPKLVDANAPRLAVETTTFADASAPASAAITVTVKNAGARSMVAAIKPRMISFEVTGPDRTVSCPGWPPTHAMPRESYREYKPDAKTSFTLLLDEICPESAFSRPGLYSVKAGVWANETGDEAGVDAFTGRARATKPTLLRLLSAKDSFYIAPPKAVPTPKPAADDAAPAKPAVDETTPASPAAPSPDAAPAPATNGAAPSPTGAAPATKPTAG